ncbi:hypothetical protein SUGI_0643910 [Cryptomeria japonica]|uniref:F-box protein At1g67340 n=1 Tax=Cryptomeria japonica TaxID=3369 RepID=UPI0024149C9A|nr:F-box protein At1g67340 [Cryptomeria japonica]GLJ31985.1 hypothetical protein SUGI_0643910 [Cryptomeria japonica]
MRTRKGTCYTSPTGGCRRDLKRGREGATECSGSKRQVRMNHLDALPDDLLLSILVKLSSSAGRPADLISALIACKRFNEVGMQPMVLQNASTPVFAMEASRWSDGSHRFLKKCADAGNVEACYTLGMIRFYCLQNRGGGASMMAKAAISSHAAALYSLAIIQFNGSGGSKKDKDLKAGVALCARAAFLGHIDALRELGHCLQDGYGVAKNVAEGRRFLVQANARELASVCPKSQQKSFRFQPSSLEPWLRNLRRNTTSDPVDTFSSLQGCPLLSDFGCNVPPPESHPAVKFMVEWFNLHPPGPGLRLCSYGGCGRPETRKHEFRRCSVCGTVNYCSRACQALDWKIRHKNACMPVDDWLEADDDDDDEDYIDEEFV